MSICDLDVVILSSIDWDFAWQRHQVFATLMSKWTSVFFVENTGFRSPKLHDLGRVVEMLRRRGSRRLVPLKNPLSENVAVVSPWVLPPSNGIRGGINERVLIPLLVRHLKKQGMRSNLLLWTYLPTPTVLSMIRQLQPRVIVYDCVSNFYGHPDAPPYLREVEDSLLNLAHAVLTDSRFLFDRYASCHQRVYQIHHGVDFDLFARAGQRVVRPGSICYFGSIHQHLDWEIIRGLAVAGFEVVLIGHISGSVPTNLPPTVRLCDPLPPDELVEAIAPFEIILLPYRTDTPFMQGVIPAKIYECLATGKPVLSSPLPNYDDDLRQVLYLCEDVQDFVATAEKISHTRSFDNREQLGLARRFSREATAQKLFHFLSELAVFV